MAETPAATPLVGYLHIVSFVAGTRIYLSVIGAIKFRSRSLNMHLIRSMDLKAELWKRTDVDL